ncbi:cysteine dioxygenase, partial [Streptomyces sp. 2MCAF27]
MTTPTAAAPPVPASPASALSASAPSALRRTARMSTFVDEVREAVGRGLAPDLTAQLVADRLAPHLGAPDLLTEAQRQGDAANYRQHLLHAEP